MSNITHPQGRSRHALFSAQRLRRAALVVVLALALGGSAEIGPLIAPRNVLLYGARHFVDQRLPHPTARGHGSITGRVTERDGAPIAGAVVFVSEADGTIFQATTNADGAYTLAALPAGLYTPMAAKSGYADAFPTSRPHQFLAWRIAAVHVHASETAKDVRFVLSRATAQPATLPIDLTLGPVETRQSDLPTTVESHARTVAFTRGGKRLTDITVYEPMAGTGPLPVLLAIYPGTPASWDRVSVPLAARGYVVLAIFPTRGLDLEADMDDTAAFVALARAGQISPRADMTRLGILGGSFTSLHVHRWLEREGGVRGAVILGGIADLFAYRLDWERGLLDLPPEVGDIDTALMALGTPDHRPEQYLRYSAAFHSDGLPPLLLAHGAKDRIVPTHQTTDFAAVLAAHGKPVETHYYPNMEHYFADASDADTQDLYAATVAFFTRTVG
ncbi:MAG: carboxypeptidase regulatory-like domain-containing protein [Thermomicrobiales bacterium]